jgi:YD repeat-containing protein
MQQEQQFNTTSGWSASYNTSRTYDLASHVTSQTYPSGHTVTYNYDSVGRLGDKDSSSLAFAGNLGDGVQRSYDSISGANAYDAASRLQEEKYGTATPLYHKQHFNLRGQLNDVRLSTVAWNTDQWNWNRGAIENWYDSTSGFPHPSTNGTNNNGNLLRSEVYIPNDDQISGYSFTKQAYTYDSLNRLASVAEYQNGSTQTSAQSYVYDRWGNRTIDISGNPPKTWAIKSTPCNRRRTPAVIACTPRTIRVTL